MSDVRLLDRSEQQVSAATESRALALPTAAQSHRRGEGGSLQRRAWRAWPPPRWYRRNVLAVPPLRAGESAAGIDWRRSARDDRLYIREREWETAHTVAIWIDRSPSMGFISSLARQSKIDRALVLGLAAADLLVRGGERVGLLGLTRADRRARHRRQFRRGHADRGAHAGLHAGGIARQYRSAAAHAGRAHLRFSD